MEQQDFERLLDENADGLAQARRHDTCRIRTFATDDGLIALEPPNG